MRSQRRTAVGVAVMAVLLAAYICFALYRVWILFLTQNIVGALMGAGLLVLSLIAVWALYRELKFGYHANRLTHRLEDENALPEDGLEAKWNGMPTREDARSVLPKYEDAVHTQPDSWKDWQRFGILLRAAGQNGPARAAIRNAIRLERADSTPDK